MGKVMYMRKGDVHSAPGPAALADSSPAEIKSLAKSGKAANYWAVGDTVPIKLSGTVGYLALDETYYAFIIGFNHNSNREGGNSVHFQFGKNENGANIAFVDGRINTNNDMPAFRMNLSENNLGGWKDSYMRTTICPAFLAAMPSEWQSVIAACNKYTDNTAGGNDTASYVTATSDQIFCLSEFEVFGTRSQANSAEQNYQSQYAYYRAGNSKIKYRHNATGTAVGWWLRSPYSADLRYFSIASTSGGSTSVIAGYSQGFAPGFMVA